MVFLYFPFGAKCENHLGSREGLELGEILFAAEWWAMRRVIIEALNFRDELYIYHIGVLYKIQTWIIVLSRRRFSPLSYTYLQLNLFIVQLFVGENCVGKPNLIKSILNLSETDNGIELISCLLFNW